VILGNQALGGTAVGGGIANLNGARLTVAFSLIGGNSAVGVTGEGGGIFKETGSILDLDAAVFAGNFASTAGWKVFRGSL
jgi:hypothetical protein